MEKQWRFFYITFVVFAFADFSIHTSSTVSACKNGDKPPRNPPAPPTNRPAPPTNRRAPPRSRPAPPRSRPAPPRNRQAPPRIPPTPPSNSPTPPRIIFHVPTRKVATPSVRELCDFKDFEMDLEWEKIILCNNREGSKWASNCMISLKGDSFFKKNVTCKNGEFVMTSMTMDSGKVRRCEIYQYYKKKCSYSVDDLIDYVLFRNVPLSAAAQREVDEFENEKPENDDDDLGRGSVSSNCKRFCQTTLRRNGINAYIKPSSCSYLAKARKIRQARKCVQCRNKGCGVSHTR